MPYQIIDNKKVEMSPDEWAMYKSIVESYTSPSNNGEDLFIDLFEVDQDGIIIFLKPPSKRHTSLEVFLFLMALMQQQHLRVMYKKIEEACAQMRKNRIVK